MKTVLKIAKKALPSVIIYLCIFCALMFAFTFFAGKDQEKNFQATELDIIMDDRDASVLSKALSDYLAKENNVSGEFDEELVSELLFTGTIDYVIYIEEGFEEKFLAGEQGGIERQSIRANVAFLDQKTELFFRYVRAELALGKTIEDACDAVLLNCDKQSQTEVKSGKSAFLMAPGYYFLAYLSYILPAILIMILGPIMYAFYKKEVKMRTDCGMVSVRKQNMAIVGGIAIVAMILWSLLIAIGAVIYGGDFTVTTYLYGMLNSFLLLLVSVAISVLIGILVKGGDALNGASNLIGMGMAFICGVFVPAELLPDYVGKIAEFLPVSWYMKNVKLLFEGESVTEYMGEFFGNCGIITIFAIAFFCIFLVVVKRKKVA
ncbi:MAG: ABC transporter permease [Lachnospiraceae bacterium]|nr:ABC transporter permease [Lachnospiraceae bacterium]